MSLAARQAVVAGLAVNALRPSRRVGIASFLSGWLTGELAPQLLALTAIDTAVAVARRRAGPADLAVAAVAAGALGALVHTAYGAGHVVEQALETDLGDAWARPDAKDLATPWRQVARPFRVRQREVERIADVGYQAGGRRARLDLYRPVEGVENAPVLLQVHGGAWVLGSKESQGRLLMNRMAAQGWVCVAPNYRLAPKHRWPAQLDDVRTALAWVREHVASYGGDPSYIVLTGGSAGGHLATLAALTADPPVAACVPFYGVYDLTGGIRRFLQRWVFTADATDADFEDASPMTHVGPDAPDFFVLHGARDTVVPVKQARRFVARLRKESGTTVSYAELPGAQHAFEVFSSIRSQAVIGAVSRWLAWHEKAHHGVA